MLTNILRVAALFAGEWIDSPGRVGAICPGSRWLAARIAREVPAGDGLVVELGGGTGVVTAALLARGIPVDRLIVVERSQGFVDYLRSRFPGASFVHADAATIMRCLPREGRISAIVSCLPLRSLPVADVEAVIAQWPRVLASDGVVVQFTYDIRKTQPVTQHLAASFATQSSHVVWANLPPARIMTSRRRK